MPNLVKILRVVADPSRLRILLLLRGEELSVAELQEILTMGQSTISTHLSQLKQAGLVEDRRTGKNSLYRVVPEAGKQAPSFQSDNLTGNDPASLKGHDSPGDESASLKGRDFTSEASAALKGHDFSRTETIEKLSGPLGPERSFLHELLSHAAQELPEADLDQASMRRIVKKRQDKMRIFFDSVAGRLGKDYVPGKSWKSMAEALLCLMPPMIIADLGTGEGASALLLAQRAKKVIAVDTSANMIEVAREQALRNGVTNVEYRLGDMEEVPIDTASIDLVFFSQSLHHALHPDRALAEANRILVPGGRILILDLVKHRFEEARELYADEWLGFSETEIESMLEKSNFTNPQISIVHKEPETPQFQTLLAVADKPVK
jgi:ubiquinone/menaquinone biosynthesis C-methylase UbiE/DNA-binding transcriptional ArsR family regulator